MDRSQLINDDIKEAKKVVIEFHGQMNHMYWTVICLVQVFRLTHIQMKSNHIFSVITNGNLPYPYQPLLLIFNSYIEGGILNEHIIYMYLQSLIKFHNFKHLKCLSFFHFSFSNKKRFKVWKKYLFEDENIVNFI